MIKLLEKWRSKQPKPTDQWSELRAILERADRPKNGDEDRLHELMLALSLCELDVEGFVAALVEEKRLQAVVGTMRAAEAEHGKIDAELIERCAARDAYVFAENEKMDLITARLQDSIHKLKSIRQAAIDLREIQNKNRELFAVPDPVRAPLPEWFTATNPVLLQRRHEAENAIKAGLFTDILPGGEPLDRMKAVMDQMQMGTAERRRSGENPPKPGDEYKPSFENDGREGYRTQGITR